MFYLLYKNISTQPFFPLIPNITRNPTTLPPPHIYLPILHYSSILSVNHSTSLFPPPFIYTYQFFTSIYPFCQSFYNLFLYFPSPPSIPTNYSLSSILSPPFFTYTYQSSIFILQKNFPSPPFQIKVFLFSSQRGLLSSSDSINI